MKGRSFVQMVADRESVICLVIFGGQPVSSAGEYWYYIPKKRVLQVHCVWKWQFQSQSCFTVLQTIGGGPKKNLRTLSAITTMLS